MNANRYRLIFDKRTGMLVPVAEFTTSAKKGSAGGRGDGTGDLTVPKWSRIGAAMAVAFGGLGVPLSINAQMVVDPNGGTTLNNAANGVPLINIVDPNAGGLSHNKFLDFNVGTDGAIFNNSLHDGQSQLGGHVMKNPHLTREATGILTEVTGTDISRIQGAMEVYGGKADLLIANPNGLYINGVSVLNANGLTLTTGRPDADGSRFGIHGGEVEIGAGGVSTVGMDHFDVIARSIKLYGRVSGGNSRARLAAGLNDFDATTGVVSKRENGGGADAPAFAIDGNAVGAMHGSHVTLLSTESGLGVRHEGSLTSSSDIVISADGDLRLRRMEANGNATLAAKNVSLGGADSVNTVSSKVTGTLDVDANGDMTITGRHDVERARIAASGTFRSDARLEAKRRAADRKARIDIAAGTIDIHGGGLQSADDLSLRADAMRIRNGANVLAIDAELVAAGLLENAGLVVATNALDVWAARLVNATFLDDSGVAPEIKNAELKGATARINAGTLDNTGSLFASADLALVLGAGDSSNAGLITTDAGPFTLEGALARLDNSGTISTSGKLSMALASLFNLDTGTVWSDTDVVLRIAGTLDNAGTIAGKDLDFAARMLRNHGTKAALFAFNNAVIEVLEDLENSDDAQITAEGSLTIDADGNLRNRDGATIVATELAIAAGADIENTAGAGIDGDKVAIAAGGNLLNDNADITAGVSLDITTAGHATNRNDGVIAGLGAADLTMAVGGDLRNESGANIEGDQVGITVAGALANDNASIVGTDVTAAVTGAVQNTNDGLIGADNTLALTGASLDNDNGDVQALDIAIDVAGALLNRNDATIKAGNDIAIKAGTLDNSARVEARNDITLDTTGNVDNHGGGRIVAIHDITANIGGDLSNRGDQTLIQAGQIKAKVAGNVENIDGAVLKATYQLDLEAKRLANRNAKILAGTVGTDGLVLYGDMKLVTKEGNVTNDDGGEIVATGLAWIDAEGNVHNNTNGKIAAENVNIRAKGDVVNTATASIDAIKRVDIRNDRMLDNDGRIGADEVYLKSGTAIDNTGRIVGGTWVYGDTTAIRNSASGVIEAKDDVNLNTDTFANVGKIFSDNYATLTIKNGLDLFINDLAHSPVANGVLTLNANDIRIDREIMNPGHIVLNATGWIDNAQGIIGGKTVKATAAGAFTNHSLVWAGTDVDITAASLRNKEGAEIEATRDLWIEVDGVLVNEAGARIAAGRNGNIDAAEFRNEVRVSGGVTEGGREVSIGFRDNPQISHWAAIFQVAFGYTPGDLRDMWNPVPSNASGLGLAVLDSDLRIEAQGIVETGGTLRINEGKKKGKGGTLHNEGQVRAGGSLYVDGHVHNQGAVVDIPMSDYLFRHANITLQHSYYNVSDSGGAFIRQYTNLYNALNAMFGPAWGVWSIEPKYFFDALRDVRTPQVSKVMSHLFGADWRATSYDTLKDKWHSQIVPNLASIPGMSGVSTGVGPELSAGGSFFHEGGSFVNGRDRVEENKALTVNIGGEEVTTIGGNFDVIRGVEDLTQAMDPTSALGDLTRDTNKKFRPTPPRHDLPTIDWSQQEGTLSTGPLDFTTPLPPVHPIFETRIEFIDQSKFFGSDYFFRQVGYLPDRTVTVIGDNYFMTELVNKQINDTVGSFFTVQYSVNGAGLVQKLMDNAGEEAQRLGLRVGVEPEAVLLDHLEKDIVWMVATEVNGVVALVPKVYLAKKTLTAVKEQRDAGVAHVAAAKDVVIDADKGGVMNSDGTIRAGKNLVVESDGEVVNSSRNGFTGGGMRAGETLLVKAKGDVTNLGADIIGHDVLIDTDGDFTDAVRMGYDDKGALVVGKRGRIRGGGADEGDARVAPKEKKKEKQGEAVMADKGANGAMFVAEEPASSHLGSRPTMAGGVSTPASSEKAGTASMHSMMGGVISTPKLGNAAPADAMLGGVISTPKLGKGNVNDNALVSAMDSMMAGVISAPKLPNAGAGSKGAQPASTQAHASPLDMAPGLVAVAAPETATSAQSPAKPAATTTDPTTPPAKSKGSVTIKAKGDIKLTASDIRAQDVTIKAGGNLTSDDVHEVRSDYSHEVVGLGGFLGGTKTTEMKSSEARAKGSRIQGGMNDGSLAMTAGGDVTLEGGDYAADVGSVRGKNVVTKTSQDVRYKETKTVTEGFVMGARASVAGNGAGVETGHGETWSATSVNGDESGGGNWSGEPGDHGEGREMNDGRANSDGKSVLGETVGGRFGYERIEVTETNFQKKNKNAQLNFGSGIKIVADETVDIGGADIRAWEGEGDADNVTRGAVYIEGGNVISTKYEDVDRTTIERKEEFTGIQASAGSSIIDMVDKQAERARNGASGNKVDAGAAAAEVIGDITNLINNDLASGSINFTHQVKHTKETNEERAQNTNTVMGDITIVSKKGDIDLAGVVLDGRGASVTLDSAQEIRIKSGQTNLVGNDSTEEHKVTIGVDASVGPTGAGVGVSAGYNGSKSESSYTGTSHANSKVIGSVVNIKSKKDTTLAGANVVAGKVNLDVDGKLNIETVQDTYNKTGTKSDWGVTVGGGVGSKTVDVGFNYGQGSSHDNRATTEEQSGITATEINGTVDGGMKLKGSHLVAEGGNLKVKGKVEAETLKDTIDRDGSYFGMGGGVGSGGLGGINISKSRDEQEYYDADQLATISGVTVDASEGIHGEVNTDVDNMVKVNRDEIIADSNISSTLNPQDTASKIKSAAKKGKNRMRSHDLTDVEAGGGRYRPITDDDGGGSRRPGTDDASVVNERPWEAIERPRDGDTLVRNDDRDANDASTQLDDGFFDRKPATDHVETKADRYEEATTAFNEREKGYEEQEKSITINDDDAREYEDQEKSIDFGDDDRVVSVDDIDTTLVEGTDKQAQPINDKGWRLYGEHKVVDASRVLEIDGNFFLADADGNMTRQWVERGEDGQYRVTAQTEKGERLMREGHKPKPLTESEVVAGNDFADQQIKGIERAKDVGGTDQGWRLYSDHREVDASRVVDVEGNMFLVDKEGKTTHQRVERDADGTLRITGETFRKNTVTERDARDASTGRVPASNDVPRRPTTERDPVKAVEVEAGREWTYESNPNFSNTANINLDRSGQRPVDTAATDTADGNYKTVIHMDGDGSTSVTEHLPKRSPNDSESGRQAAERDRVSPPDDRLSVTHEREDTTKTVIHLDDADDAVTEHLPKHAPNDAESGRQAAERDAANPPADGRLPISHERGASVDAQAGAVAQVEAGRDGDSGVDGDSGSDASSRDDSDRFSDGSDGESIADDNSVVVASNWNDGDGDGDDDGGNNGGGGASRDRSASDASSSDNDSLKGVSSLDGNDDLRLSDVDSDSDTFRDSPVQTDRSKLATIDETGESDLGDVDSDATSFTTSSWSDDGQPSREDSLWDISSIESNDRPAGTKSSSGQDLSESIADVNRQDIRETRSGEFKSEATKPSNAEILRGWFKGQSSAETAKKKDARQKQRAADHLDGKRGQRSDVILDVSTSSSELDIVNAAHDAVFNAGVRETRDGQFMNGPAKPGIGEVLKGLSQGKSPGKTAKDKNLRQQERAFNDVTLDAAARQKAAADVAATAALAVPAAPGRDRSTDADTLIDQYGLEAEQYDVDRREALERGAGKDTLAGTLTDVQYMAVGVYTNSAYQHLNGNLRSGEPLSAADKALADTLSDALRNAPRERLHDGTTYRGLTLPAGKLADMLASGEFTDQAFLSTTTDPKVANAYAKTKAGEVSVVLQIQGKNGVSVSEVSIEGGDEAEILFNRGTRFEIVRSTPPGTGSRQHVIELREKAGTESARSDTATGTDAHLPRKDNDADAGTSASNASSSKPPPRALPPLPPKLAGETTVAAEPSSTAARDQAPRMTRDGRIENGLAKPGAGEMLKGWLVGKSSKTTAREKNERQQKRAQDDLAAQDAALGRAPPLQMDGLTRTGPKMNGETAGAVYANADGDTVFVKGTGGDEDWAREEVLAGKLLERAGVKVPDVQTIALGAEHDGGIGIASKGVVGAERIDWDNDADARKAARDDFAAQAWVANWDAIGEEGDNYVKGADGAFTSIDHGGALDYRATGMPKGGAFGREVRELETMRSRPKPDSSAARAYAGMTDEEIRDGAARVARIRNESVNGLVDKYGPRDPAKRADLAKMLNERKAYLAQVAGDPAQSESGVRHDAAEVFVEGGHPKVMVDGVKRNVQLLSDGSYVEVGLKGGMNRGGGAAEKMSIEDSVGNRIEILDDAQSAAEAVFDGGLRETRDGRFVHGPSEPGLGETMRGWLRGDSARKTMKRKDERRQERALEHLMKVVEDDGLSPHERMIDSTGIASAPARKAPQVPGRNLLDDGTAVYDDVRAIAPSFKANLGRNSTKRSSRSPNDPLPALPARTDPSALYDDVLNTAPSSSSRGNSTKRSSRLPNDPLPPLPTSQRN